MNETLKKLLNLLERAGSTFAEQFFTVMIGTGAASLLVAPRIAEASDRAGFAAVVSIGTSVLTWGWSKQSDTVDSIFRVGKTGLQVFLGDLLASAATPSLVHADYQHALGAALTVMGPAALKVLAAQGVATTIGGSVLPAVFDHGATTTAPGVVEQVDPAHLNYGDAEIDPSQLDYGEPGDQNTDVVLPFHVEAHLMDQQGDGHNNVQPGDQAGAHSATG